ncbi:MAG: hypothetical protein BWX64_02810 [Acidobacteria bacterium ADurb.Bin051]|nr:MAG: hypothetical protein BWX64_02810 [Acidobacteria bacterium ADurb.Bin051]
MTLPPVAERVVGAVVDHGDAGGGPGTQDGQGRVAGAVGDGAVAHAVVGHAQDRVIGRVLAEAEAVEPRLVAGAARAGLPAVEVPGHDLRLHLVHQLAREDLAHPDHVREAGDGEQGAGAHGNPDVLEGEDRRPAGHHLRRQTGDHALRGGLARVGVHLDDHRHQLVGIGLGEDPLLDGGAELVGRLMGAAVLHELTGRREGVEVAAALRIGPDQVGVVGDVLHEAGTGGLHLVEPPLLDRPDEADQVQRGAGRRLAREPRGQVGAAAGHGERMAVEEDRVHLRIHLDPRAHRRRQRVEGRVAHLVESEGAVVVPEDDAGGVGIELARSREDLVRRGREPEARAEQEQRETDRDEACTRGVHSEPTLRKR